MYHAYSNIFTRLGLKFRAVLADSGSIGGNLSHEFHVLADSGEDAIAFSTESDFAANVELAEAIAPSSTRPTPKFSEISLINTPNQQTIEEISTFFEISPKKCLKTLIVKGDDDSLVALLLRGDHDLNPIKAEKIAGIASPFTFATAEEIKQATGAEPGSIGPLNLNMLTIADHSVTVLSDFVCGTNETGKHFCHVNWDRDLPLPEQIEDLRTVVEGDPSPDGQGTLTLARGIEVGHIFQLGTKYSEAMKASVSNEAGKNQVMTMGCYGIGISRIVAAAIEQAHDDKGILWSEQLAPFQVALCPMNMHKSIRLKEAAEKLYHTLLDAGIDVLFDDRKVRAGFMFSDMELIGIPHRIVIGDKSLDANQIEYRARTDSENRFIDLDEIVPFLVSTCTKPN